METRLNLENMVSFRKDPEVALDSYKKLGFHIEYDFWNPKECEEIIEAGRQLDPYKKKVFCPAYNPHRINLTFLNAMRNQKLITIMEKLIGGRVSGLQTQFFYCPPNTPGYAMHQDNSFVEAGRDYFASAWTALQNAPSEMGGLVVYPRSHIEPLLPREKINGRQSKSQDKNANQEQVILPKGYNKLELTVPIGATVFLHGHIVHSSNDNNSNKFRYALLITYIKEGAKFRPGNTAKRETVLLY